MPSKDHAETLTVAGHEVRVTHPDKPYFAREAKLTKLEIVRYYLAVADGAVAGIRDRPVVLKRFVDGAEGQAFYQKRAPDNRPPWLRTVTLSFPSGRTAEEVVVDDAAGLAWIVNLGCIELHPHPVRSGDLDHPDELRVDLDPGPGVVWDDVRRVALEVNALLVGFIEADQHVQAAKRAGVPIDEYIAVRAKEIPLGRVGRIRAASSAMERCRSLWNSSRRALVMPIQFFMPQLARIGPLQQLHAPTADRHAPTGGALSASSSRRPR